MKAQHTTAWEAFKSKTSITAVSSLNSAGTRLLFIYYPTIEVNLAHDAVRVHVGCILGRIQLKVLATPEQDVQVVMKVVVQSR